MSPAAAGRWPASASASCAGRCRRCRRSPRISPEPHPQRDARCTPSSPSTRRHVELVQLEHGVARAARGRGRWPCTCVSQLDELGLRSGLLPNIISHDLRPGARRRSVPAIVLGRGAPTIRPCFRTVTRSPIAMASCSLWVMKHDGEPVPLQPPMHRPPAPRRPAASASRSARRGSAPWSPARAPSRSRPAAAGRAPGRRSRRRGRPRRRDVRRTRRAVPGRPARRARSAAARRRASGSRARSASAPASQCW